MVELLLEHQDIRNDRAYIVTDYAKFVIAAKPLQMPSTVTIKFTEEGETETPASAKQYKVTVTELDQLEVSHLLDALSSTSVSNTYEKGPLLQAFNIWLDHYARSSAVIATPSGGKAYDRGVAVMSFNYGLEAWRGFFSSVRASAGRLLVNINVAHRAFWAPQLLSKLYQAYSAGFKSNVVIQSAFRGIRVERTHLTAKPKGKQGKPAPIKASPHRISLTFCRLTTAPLKFKTISGFAKVSDGKKPDGSGVDGNPNPPRVKHFAAGPFDVQFWAGDKPTKPGGKENKAKPSKYTGYISVADFFAKGNDCC